MSATTILWAGKQLDVGEEVRLRRLVHHLRRTGGDELADDLERFLPEREDAWSDDERASGASLGPNLGVVGGVLADEDPETRDSA